jgi:hypothetical protein
MRTHKLSFCAAAMATLLMVEYGVTGNSGRQIVTTPQPRSSEQTVEQKGDGLSLPTTVQGKPGKPSIRNQPEPRPVSKPQASNSKPALLQGCEPALSPLTGAVPTGLYARCFADAGEPVALNPRRLEIS